MDMILLTDEVNIFDVFSGPVKGTTLLDKHLILPICNVTSEVMGMRMPHTQ